MRDLDERIAREVFGCRWRKFLDYRYLAGPNVTGWPGWTGALADGTEQLFPDVPDGMIGVPPYSTEIAAAWLVVEEMARRGWFLCLTTGMHPPGSVYRGKCYAWLAERGWSFSNGLTHGKFCPGCTERKRNGLEGKNLLRRQRRRRYKARANADGDTANPSPDSQAASGAQ